MPDVLIYKNWTWNVSSNGINACMHIGRKKKLGYCRNVLRSRGKKERDFPFWIYLARRSRDRGKSIEGASWDSWLVVQSRTRVPSTWETETGILLLDIATRKRELRILRLAHTNDSGVTCIRSLFCTTFFPRLPSSSIIRSRCLRAFR